MFQRIFRYHCVRQSKLLTTRVYAGTPYKDKSVTVTYHQAYLQWGNLLTVLTHDDDLGWHTDRYLTAGDIRVFLQHSDWFRDEQGGEISHANNKRKAD